MDKEIQDHQDKTIDYVIKAKQLQNESTLVITLNRVPVDKLLRALAKTTTREDLKERIKKALNE